MHGNFGKKIWNWGIEFEAVGNPVTDKLSKFFITRIWDNFMKMMGKMADRPKKSEQNRYIGQVSRVLKKNKIKVSAVFFGHIHRPFIQRKKSRKRIKPLMVSLGSWGLFPTKKDSQGIRNFVTISDNLEVKLYSLNHKNGKKPIVTGKIL